MCFRQMSTRPSSLTLSTSKTPHREHRKLTSSSLRTLFTLTALSAAALLSPVLSAETPAPAAPRIAGQVNEQKLTKLPGNVPLLARKQNDLGEAPAATQITHVRLVLSRSPQQQAALDQYMGELQSKTSPNYHKWLTPEQFGKYYGPADSDIAALVAWLESHGLKLEQVATGRTDIAFTGTVAQLEEAFHTKIHTFQGHAAKSGEATQFLSNIVDPSIPAALTPVVQGVAHLNTIRPVAHNIAGRPGTFDPETKRLKPTSSFTNPSKFQPQLTSTDPSFLYLVPGDAATIYDTPTPFNANFASSATVYNGSGVTIGVGGASPVVSTVVTSYRSRFLNNTSAPTVTNVDGATDTSDADEAYLDLELSGGMAPGASIHYYVSSDLTTAIEKMLSDNSVDIFSLSFGECEFNLDNSGNTLLNGYWQQAASQGIAVTVSTGDDGSAGCDLVTDSNGNDYPTADNGLAVSGFASTPYNVAVGGTDLIALNTAFSTYVNTNAASTNLYRSALSYIPEAAWNDSTTNDTTLNDNIPQDGSNGIPANIAAGSGGVSSCAVQTDTTNPASTCSSGYAKPSWQRGTGVPADGVRDVPDISLMAGDGADSAAWLVCTDDTGTVSGVTVTADCSTQSNGSFYFFGYGGTSTAAPSFAGILALVEQKQGDRLGQAAQGLYDLYNSSHANAVFHDTVSGNNSVSCDVNTPNCAKDSGGFYYETGYNTTTGYDVATGLGSVDATQLVNYWGSAIGTDKATVIVTPASTSVTVSQSLSVAISVTGVAAGGIPTGTVVLSGGGYTSASTTLSANGMTTISIPAGKLSSGSNTLTVTYNGDTNYAAATGTASVTVVAPVVSLSNTSLVFPSTNIGTTSASQTVTLTNSGTAGLTVTGVTITGSNPTSFAETSTCTSVAAAGTCTITVSFTPTLAGPLTATVSVADNAGNTPQTITLTGTGVVDAPAVSLSPTSLTFASTTVGSPAATQSITLKNSGTEILTVTGVSITGTSASSYTQTNTCTSVAIAGTCAITVTFTPTASGTLTASVSIADNASGSPQTVSLTGTGAAVVPASFTLAATTATATKGTAATSTVTATALGGYNGTINLTCSVAALSGGKDAPTCSTSAITVASGSTTGTGTVTVTSTGSSAKRGQIASNLKSGGKLAAGTVALAGLLLFGIPARRRVFRSLLGIFLLASAFGILSGCGGSGNSGTTSGSYTVTVTGTDSATSTLTATTTFTATIN